MVNKTMSKTAFTQYINDVLDNSVKPISYYLELEKQQIVDAYRDGLNAHRTNFCNREQYYKLKFKYDETTPTGIR